MRASSTPFVLLSIFQVLLSACAQSDIVADRPVTTRPGQAPIVTRPQAVAPVSMVYSTGEREDQFLVAQRQLGLVPAPGVTFDRLRTIARELDYRVVSQMGDGFLIVAIAESLSPQDLFRRAEEVGARYEDEFTNRPFQAGVVFYPVGTGAPFVGYEDVIVQFRSEPSAAALASAIGGRPYIARALSQGLPNMYLLTAQAPGAVPVIEFVRQLNARIDVQFAHLDGVAAFEKRQVTPNDALYGNQWHHANTGQAVGTPDADTDTDWAWTITQGAAGVVVAVTDDGFDVNHPDYQNNLWTNPGEIPGDGLDNDGNGWADDVNGFNFAACSVAGPPFCNGAITGADHGTSVAGVVAAQSGNAIGVAGACPQCSVALVQTGGSFVADAQAIAYAAQINANISTNSWGYANPPAVVNTAIGNTAGAGTTILFAMANGNQDDCVANDISANANVIAVSALSNQDRKVTESAWGNCMDVSAPSHRGYGPNLTGFPGFGVPYTGTLNIVTTDRIGNNGYNNTNPSNAAIGFDTTYCPGETGVNNYTLCFGGTSAATPLTAGIAGLVLSANNALTRAQLQQVLQDTTDKPDDAAAGYRESDGFSQSTAAGFGGVSSHGYGRVNAFEAVRLVAPTAQGGRGNVDVVLRDNRLDWGNTEQRSNVLMEPTRGFIPHWRSVDIKVDAPPFEATAPTTPASFEAFASEDPIAETVNRVYVRIRNRGQTSATDVRIKLQWAFAGAGLPALPADYWTQFPNDSAVPSSAWTTIDPQLPIATLVYSGSSVAGTGADNAAILEHDWNVPALDSSAPNFRHFCLFAVADATNDPINETGFVPDVITPTNNNATHRNVSVQDPMGRNRSFMSGLTINNPFDDRSIRTRLRALGPDAWRIDLGAASNERTLAAGEAARIELSIAGRGDGRVSVVQEIFDASQGEFVPFGGFDYVFGDPEVTGRPAGGVGAGPGAPPASGAYANPFAISARAGVAIPHSSGFSTGISTDLGIEFALSPNTTVEGIVGFHQLSDDGFGADLDITRVSANVRYFFGTRRNWTPFINGGVGTYVLDPGSSEFGLNVGAGIDYALSSQWFLEGAYNAHWIDAGSADFSSVQLGVRFKF